LSQPLTYQSFYDTYKEDADIYIVYILEAHFVEKDASGNFTGGWPIGYQYNYEQPKTLEQRLQMVDLLMDEYSPSIPVLVDTMENHFQNAYRPWPDRAFVFRDKMVQYISRIKDDGTRNGPWTDQIKRLLNYNDFLM
jgi:hypothetical protein